MPGIVLVGLEARTFRREDVLVAAARQDHLCLWCGKPFTPTNPPNGDHRHPWAKGGPNTPADCDARHEVCNLQKGMGRAKPRTWADDEEAG